MSIVAWCSCTSVRQPFFRLEGPRSVGADVVMDAGSDVCEMRAGLEAGRSGESDRRDASPGSVQAGLWACAPSASFRAAILRMVSFNRSESSPVSMMYAL